MTLQIGLVGPLPPPNGGMANQAKQLFQLLQQEPAIQVEFLQTNLPYSIRWVENLTGVRAVFRLVQYVVKLFSLAQRVDVIHVLSNSGWSWQLFSAPVLWVGWLKKKPVIINYRGGEARAYFEQSIFRVRPSLKKASAIVVPSTYLQTVFADFSFQSQVIPNIINLERFSPIKNKVFTEDCLHIVITRNLESIYGIQTAISALALVRESIPNVRMSIAGSGPQKLELEQWVHQLQLQQAVKFTGSLQPDEVADLYQQADMMLNPTTVDNMPNSVLEAMASGVPVITTNVGGIPYIVENNKTALFVEANNAQAMAEKIIQLSQNKSLYHILRSNGLSEVQQYAWVHVKKKWLTLYQSLGAEKNGALY